MAAGLDSLGTVELRNSLEGTLNVSLPPTLAMDYPTATAIAEFISTKLPAVAATAEESQGSDGIQDEYAEILSRPLTRIAHRAGVLAVTAFSCR